VNSKKLLVVVDMQNDFIDGALGSKAAQSIVGKVCDKIDEWDGYTCFTLDTHYDDYLETNEGRHIPVEHCINETEGWKLHPEIEKRRDGRAFTFYKETFGSIGLLDAVQSLDIEEVQLAGLCTDICVVSNAMLVRAGLPNSEIIVDASCCAGTSKENHDAALKVMRQCCIDVINDD